MSQAVNRRFRQGRELQMLAALTLGFMLAIWVVVIWGAAYFNQNVN
jgi:urea transporter